MAKVGKCLNDLLETRMNTGENGEMTGKNR